MGVKAKVTTRTKGKKKRESVFELNLFSSFGAVKQKGTEIYLTMESSEDLYELVTPVRVKSRSRIPVRSPGGGSSPFGRGSTRPLALKAQLEKVDKENCLEELAEEWQKREEDMRHLVSPCNTSGGGSSPFGRGSTRQSPKASCPLPVLEEEKEVNVMDALKEQPENNLEEDFAEELKTPEGKKEMLNINNAVISSPPTFASSPHRRAFADLLSPSKSIWSSSADGEDGGQGLGLSLLQEGGEGTLTSRILAAFVDCCFCA